MNDLLDVLHFMFEEDMIPASGEQQEARGKLRTRIYTEMYGRPSYDWTPEAAQGAGGTVNARGAAPTDRPPREGEGPRHYEYIPPTKFDYDAENPFGDVLDAPLG